MNLQDALRTAVAHHNAGRLAEAERLYREILRVQRDHPVASTLLARLALRAGRTDEARSLLSVALARVPDYMQAHNTAGECAEQLGEPVAASRAYRRALLLVPGQAGALVALGNLAQQDSDAEAPATAATTATAVAMLYRRALAVQPGSIPAANNLAAVLLKTLDPAAALAVLGPVLARDPGHVRANAYRTIALRAVGRDEEADRLIGFGSLVRAIRLDDHEPRDDPAAFNTGIAAAMKAHPNLSSDWDPRTRAIRGGAIVPRLFESRHPALAAFERRLRQAIDGYIAGLPDDPDHPYLSRKPSAYQIDIWGNFLGPGDHQSAHIHNRGWMSGVYYVSVPDHDAEADPRAGWIEFNRPGYGIPCLGGARGVEAMRPEPGMVILFPSYVWHGTIPFTGTGERISIAFDLHIL